MPELNLSRTSLLQASGQLLKRVSGQDEACSMGRVRASFAPGMDTLIADLTVEGEHFCVTVLLKQGPTDQHLCWK